MKRNIFFIAIILIGFVACVNNRISETISLNVKVNSSFMGMDTVIVRERYPGWFMWSYKEVLKKKTDNLRIASFYAEKNKVYSVEVWFFDGSFKFTEFNTKDLKNNDTIIIR